MNINMSPTREKYPLSKKKIIKKTISSIVGTIVGLFFIGIFFGPIIFGMLTTVNIPYPTILDILGKLMFLYPILFLIILVLTYLYQRWYFETYFYDITDDYLIIKKDPITPKEITIPWERIQDVYVDQDLFDRIFGLYDVHLSTATLASGIHAHIDGTEKNAAEGLRAFLLEKVKSRISRPTQQIIK